MYNQMEYKKEYKKTAETKAVTVRRVAKVTSEGKRMRFSAMVVAGDRNGSVSVALGRGMDTKSAISKAEKRACNSLKKIALVGDTIPHEIKVKRGAAIVLLRPAKPGAGVIAGSSSRIVLELAGVLNVYCKQLGSNDLIANTYCTFEALKQLRNDRVLARMTKMQERVGLREKIDSEKKAKENKQRSKRKAEDSKRDSRGNKMNDKNNVSRKYTKKK